MKHIYKHFIMHYFYAAANGKQLYMHVWKLNCSSICRAVDTQSVPRHNGETSGAWSTGHFGKKF